MDMLAPVTSFLNPVGRRRALPAHRAGDIALFLIWVAFAAATGSGALDEVQDHNRLAAAHRGMVAVVFLLNAALFLLRGPAVRRGAGLGPMLIAFVGTWAVVPLAMVPMTWQPGWLLAATTLGMIAAYAFVLWALVTLRRNFSIFPEARKLVRHGPYALVRHPLYAAYILTYLLVALPRLGPVALALVVVGIGGEVLRARNEERVLAAAFPGYTAYAAVTPRFVPRARGNHLLPSRETAHDAAAAAR
jgi:protein-S-isoprenylcysteine O-methyltransferase Ste14